MTSAPILPSSKVNDKQIYCSNCRRKHPEAWLEYSDSCGLGRQTDFAGFHHHEEIAARLTCPSSIVFAEKFL